MFLLNNIFFIRTDMLSALLLICFFAPAALASALESKGNIGIFSKKPKILNKFYDISRIRI